VLVVMDDLVQPQHLEVADHPGSLNPPRTHPPTRIFAPPQQFDAEQDRDTS